MEKQKNIPKLRFPEFKGEWETKEIGEILTIGNGRDYKHLKYGNIPVFGTGGLMTKVDDYLYDGETVCIGRKGTIDKPIYFNGKIWTVDTLFYTYDYKLSSVKFIYNIFQRINWKNYNEASGVPSLSKSTIEKIEITIPTLPEQTRIASFFTVLDQKIAELKQKKNLLEQYKKGVMQKLFSQELRFRDENGKEFSKWKKERIKGYIDFLSGYAFKGEDISEDSTGIPLLRGISITEGKLRRSEEIDRYYCGDTTKISKYFLKQGDIVIGMDGSKVGRNTALVDTSFDNSLLVQRVARIRGNLKGFLPFIYHHINSYLFQRYVDEVKTSSGIPHISANQINEFKIYFPCYNEQVKIANFLSAIDEKISRTENQIQKTQEWKKGLLQQMFV